MKKTLIIFISIFCIFIASAQPPQKMSYQVVVRDHNNELVTNQAVGLRISILQDSIGGYIVFAETHTATTNANALATVQIGTGTQLYINSLADIDWAHHDYFLRAEIDPAGGSNYSISGTQQLITVPYAFYAGKADFNKLENRPVGNTMGDILYWNTSDSSWHIVPAGQPGEVLTMDTNNIPIWGNTNCTPNKLPSVTTVSVSNITLSSATIVRVVTDSGGAALVVSGICWSTTPHPTTADNQTFDGLGLGTFTSAMNGLSLNTTYYVRAYATNNAGTAYGNELNFTITATLPTITTTAVSNINSTTAVSGGNILADGGAPVTARGVCWSTSPNPTIADSITANGSGTGSFTSNITGLTVNSTYYVRAYATNSVGTAYGNEYSFSTPSISLCGTVTDRDGNVYNGVLIGTQCWMKENLRSTQYSNGTSIPLGSSVSSTTGYRYYPNNNVNNVATYGYLYNWKAVMNGAASSNSNPSGVQGICPTGWHVPSSTEFTQLSNYLSSQSQYWCGNDNTYTAKSIASTNGWNNSSTTCDVGNDVLSNNATGFDAKPAGDYFINSQYENFGTMACFWFSTSVGTDDGFNRAIWYNSKKISGHSSGYTTGIGYSVRCVKD